MKKLLVTGFKPFLDYSVNPSESMVTDLSHHNWGDLEVEGRILPVSFDSMKAFCSRELTQTNYSAILLLGLNAEIDHIAIEKRAVNVQDSRFPDTDGQVKRQTPINTEGPEYYDTNVDILNLIENLDHSTGSIKPSMHAGTYVCNTLYYLCLEYAIPQSIPCLFIHLPQKENMWSMNALRDTLVRIGTMISQPEILQRRKNITLYTQDMAESFLYDFINYEKKTGVAYTEENYNLDRYRSFLYGVGHPERGSQYIHVAGTKGKGSTCAMVSSLVSALGYRAGLYSSPHLINLRERIRLDGKPISEPDFLSEVSVLHHHIKSKQEKLNQGYRTTFELLTTTAFSYFEKMHPKWVVLETGMGGRLDCTNVVSPVITALTCIDLDHTDTLGTTLKEITGEKAGIGKSGVPMIVGSQLPSVYALLKTYARKTGAVLQNAGSLVSIRKIEPCSSGLCFDIRIGDSLYKGVETRLHSFYQVENCRTALAIVARLQEMGNLKISEEGIRKGLRQLVWPGRFTVLDKPHALSLGLNCRVVIDGAHNPRAIQTVGKTLHSLYRDHQIVTVFACPANKNVSGMLRALKPFTKVLVACRYNNSRAVSTAQISTLASGMFSKTVETPDLKTALKWAGRNTKSENLVFITGSLYLAGEALQLAGMEEQCLRIY